MNSEGASSPDSSRDAKAALITALAHNLDLGAVRGGFSLDQHIRHARDTALIFREAVLRILGKPGLNRLPQPLPIPNPGELSAAWRDLLALAEAPLCLRVGREGLHPFVSEQAQALKVPLEFGGDSDRLVVRFRLDRKTLPGTGQHIIGVVAEFPLRAPLRDLALASEEYSSALAGRWLRGETPVLHIAPRGLRVRGLTLPLRVTSPLVLSWTLVPDKERAEITWLQGLVVRQSTLCGLPGGKTRELPFETLHPGEPAILDIDIQLEIVR